jgi:hypothetical protein
VIRIDEVACARGPHMSQLCQVGPCRLADVLSCTGHFSSNDKNCEGGFLPPSIRLPSDANNYNSDRTELWNTSTVMQRYEPHCRLCYYGLQMSNFAVVLASHTSARTSRADPPCSKYAPLGLGSAHVNIRLAASKGKMIQCLEVREDHVLAGCSRLDRWHNRRLEQNRRQQKGR